jgi:hypothetical protein
MALSVPLSRFTQRVGGGSAFFVRPQASILALASWLAKDFGGSICADCQFWISERGVCQLRFERRQRMICHILL